MLEVAVFRALYGAMDERTLTCQKPSLYVEVARDLNKQSTTRQVEAQTKGGDLAG